MKQPIIINALDTEHYQDCHIKNSIGVPLNELENYANTKLKKDDYIIVYCAHYECPISREAYKLLTKLGFTNVQAYEGGVVEWKQKNYPLVGACALFERFFKNPPQPKAPEKGMRTVSAEELKSIMHKYNML
ncbi:MAG: rhodanese-like domain-containing protein [Candidatus Babeliaceae bacterium]